MVLEYLPTINPKITQLFVGFYIPHRVSIWVLKFTNQLTNMYLETIYIYISYIYNFFVSKSEQQKKLQSSEVWNAPGMHNLMLRLLSGFQPLLRTLARFPGPFLPDAGLGRFFRRPSGWAFGKGLTRIQCGAPVYEIAKCLFITSITIGFMMLITIVFMGL